MEQFLYDKKALCKRYGRERRAIVRTIKAAGLDPKKRLYSDYEVKTFIDPARSLFEKGHRATTICQLLTSSSYCREGNVDALVSTLSLVVGADGSDNACCCCSREQLSDHFRISLDTVKRSLVVAGLNPLRDDFTAEEVMRFTTVRTLFRQGKHSAVEITRMMKMQAAPTMRENAAAAEEDKGNEKEVKQPPKTYTKRALAAIYSLSYDTVKRTLKACHLDTRRTRYTEEERRSYFEPARRLFEANFSSQEVQTYFSLKAIKHN